METKVGVKSKNISALASVKNGFLSCIIGYFSYSTVKVVRTGNVFVAIIFRALQYLIIGYIVGYNIKTF